MNLDFSFLISASRGVYLYQKDKIRQIFSGGVCFGLGHHNGQYIVLNRNNQDGTGGGDPTGINSLEFFDKDFNHLGGVLIDFIKDGHQFYCDSNGDIIITNTGLNILTKVTQKGEVINLAPDGIQGQDIHHYNSLSFKYDKWYVCQHRKYEKDDAGVSVFNKDWQFIEYIKSGKHAHDCIVQDGFLWSTDSFNGNLIRTELTTKKQMSYPVSKYLTRGIIISYDKLLVGLSEFDDRANRHGIKTGRIMVFNYPEISYEGLIEIQDCGQINNLLLV